MPYKFHSPGKTRTPGPDRRPASLYYYTALEYFEQEARRCALWLGTPHSFNDARDCDLSLLEGMIRRLSIQDLRKLVDASAAYAEERKAIAAKRLANAILDDGWTFGVGKHAADASGYVSDYVAGHAGVMHQLAALPDAKLSAAVLRYLGGLIDQIGVKCLTGSWDNELMWSLYGRAGKGVCIGVYEPSHLFTGWRHNVGYSPIRYVDDRRHYLERPTLQGMVHALMTTKYSSWAYEDERRIVTFAGHGYVQMRPTALREVLLGAEAARRKIGEAPADRKARFEAFFEGLACLRRAQPAWARMRLYLCLTDSARPYRGRYEVPDNQISRAAKLLGTRSSIEDVVTALC